MDHADQLAGGGEDGLLVALPRPEGAEVAVELAVLGSGGGVRALDEDPPERRVALPGASAPPPAAALVVARTEPGPCGAVRVRGEHADVGGPRVVCRYFCNFVRACQAPVSRSMPVGRGRRHEFCFPHFGFGRGGRMRPRN